MTEVFRRAHVVVITVITTLALISTVFAATAAGTPERPPTAQGASQASVTTATHPMAGVAYHAFWTGRTDADRRAMFDRLRGLKARWVRIGLPWALVQPDRPTASDGGWSTWGLDLVDRVVRMAHQRGLKISFTFVGTPDWANGGKGPLYLPTNPSDYARVIRVLAHRYRERVQSWEIWNEANHDVHLKGATLGDYVELLCRAYPAVNRGSPRAKVISAGTGGVDFEWVRALYNTGAKRCFDVLAVHPYVGDISPRHKYNPSSAGPPLWLQKVTQVRRAMRAHGDTATRVWFTEFGWQTGGEGVTPQQQATYLVDMMKMTDRRLPYVSRMSWYTARDEVSSRYGLYTADLKAKPAAAAMRDYLARR